MSGLVVFVCLSAAALLLLWPGRLSVPRDRGQAAPHPHRGWISDPALMLDLVAAMLEAGQPLASALAILAEGADPATARDLNRLLGALDLGVPWDTAWQLSVGRRTPPPDSLATGPSPAAEAPLPGSAASALSALGPALRFTATTGAPSAAVLYSQADALRRRRQAESRRRAAALGVRLVVPLGLCSLPAFIALTVVPLLISLAPGGR